MIWYTYIWNAEWIFTITLSLTCSFSNYRDICDSSYTLSPSCSVHLMGRATSQLCIRLQQPSIIWVIHLWADAPAQWYHDQYGC